MKCLPVVNISSETTGIVLRNGWEMQYTAVCTLMSWYKLQTSPLHAASPTQFIETLVGGSVPDP